MYPSTHFRETKAEFTMTTDVPTTDNRSLSNNSMTGNLTEDVPGFMEEVQTQMTFKIASYINVHWFPILIPIGLIGNTLSFLVMIKPSNRKMSTCIYMLAISINDNLMMLLALHNWLLRMVGYEWPLVQCKIINWLTASVLQNSRYQVLAMTIDKYVAIKWPHKAATYSTPRKVKFILIGIFIFTLFYNVFHIFLSSMVKGKCRANAVGGTIVKVFTWVNFLNNGIIPILMLIYMNYVIVQTIKHSGSTSKFKHESDTKMGMDTRQRKMKSAENQVTIMLLLVTTLFIILQIPTYTRYIYMAFVAQNTPSQFASFILFSYITYALLVTNNGINFFLYCISGQKFRDDLKEMLCCNRKICAKKNESQSGSVFTLSASQNTLESTLHSDHKTSIR